ncbi:stimulated by retinoic acid gene 6 protein-like, partial [Aplysia californica]|uniref:Stimulated by retinoic acid gene 6 protein-like n=1 Tax=Aplysia californica TaxID=6500 RepID=A0ABM1A1I5_APLCA
MAHFYEASSFLQDLDILLKILKQGNRTLLEDVLEQKCEPRMDDQMYFQLCLIPAFLILISFSLTQRRRNVMVDCFRGRPGFVYPMDMLTRSNRLSYACAFGATVYLVYKVVFENFYAFDYEGPAYLHTLAAIASMLVYGMVYFPVFACLSIGSVYGYGLGALYVWMMTVVEILRLFDCDEELTESQYSKPWKTRISKAQPA